VAYFMVSVDTPEDNKRFAEQEQANFPFLSDPERKVAEAYGVLSPPNATDPSRPRYARRWMFYIGPDGKLLKVDKVSHTTDAGASLVATLEALNVPKKK
jgi:thioredoxin-dependent peroxiredoxin